MRWLITGAGGMLGRELVARLTAAGCGNDRVIALDRSALDVTQRTAVFAALNRYRPDVVVNCAAYTAVEAAESDEAAAWAVNGAGPGHLAAACAEYGIRLIHVSTDYVFSGDARSPYGEDSPPAPRTAYGRSKAAGERAVLAAHLPPFTVVRTAWLYGAHGRSFVRTMVEAARRGKTVRVVADQYGQPTWATDTAARIVVLGRASGAGGVFHATNAGVATWHELASEIYRALDADPGRVHAISSAEYAGPARRPAYTVLGHDRWQEWGIAPLRHWRTALRHALDHLR
ncbi:NAD(P)-dependent oxidoreductase [Streptomyces nigrescens]|uniref:dTDP-4-dehydrorhamnose reductase n=2 Tax=Streptomyces TaxID=1883 RepID=A0ABN6QYI3_STRNI|nr:dTDP-4-dehydrorhamnose reductase [Streptomyces nigrescens]MEE4421636.1 dTDP-4-dehydrorhamnose reductase [Streptomyces sp. DSM 41528]BDM71249.1 NAD(P)-dependent oxidoreductase [Streptomyces nigrescens]